MTNAFMLSGSDLDKQNESSLGSSQRGLTPLDARWRFLLFASDHKLKQNTIYKEWRIKDESQDSGEDGWDFTSYNGKYTYKN